VLTQTLTAACTLTLLATGYLTLSLAVLHPPRANVPAWLAQAAIFAAQSVLTLAGLLIERPPIWLRALASAAGCVLIGIALWRVEQTLTNPHFEGCNLLLAAMLAVQAALTLAAFARPRWRDRPM